MMATRHDSSTLECVTYGACNHEGQDGPRAFTRTLRTCATLFRKFEHDLSGALCVLVVDSMSALSREREKSERRLTAVDFSARAIASMLSSR